MSGKKQCPFVSSHLVPEDNFYSHILKCSKIHKEKSDVKRCPYNTTHFIKIDEYDQHIIHDCENKPTLEQQEKTIEISESLRNLDNEKKKIKIKNKDENRNHEEVKVESNGDKKIRIKSLPYGKEEEKINVKVTDCKGSEGFTLKKKTINQHKNEEKSEIAKKKEDDCKGQIF